ncbi:MAG: hypothetical protein M1816_006474 [Peltula sp. TS41687]|nr:MAG: hypothetical protein M1816_006474 [Peltula sp. TS41687]
MVTTFDSPRSGGTLHLPSPTHVHHSDPIRSLRRSLSRSPSKMPSFRLVPSKSPSPSRGAPLTPSPVSPSSGSDSFHTPASVKLPSPLAVSFAPSAKVQKLSIRKSYASRASPRIRTSPTFSIRRPLSQSRDGGNGRASSPMRSKSAELAEREKRSASPVDLLKNDKEFTELNTHLNVRKLSGPISTTSSPLKRGDGMMDLDQDSLGSPVAKRRSLHSAALGGDFNVFEHAASSSRATEKRHDGALYSEGTGTQNVNPAGASPFFVSMPKRTSSLRKSTLQQRYHDKPNFAQSKPNPDLAFEFASHGTANPKPKQHRMSLENFLPPMARDSPFTSAGFLPNASIHPVSQGNIGRQGQPHPLSQTISQSSSASSIADESPSHAPIHAPTKHVQQPVASNDFSKSLPIGAIRPVAKHVFSKEQQNQEEMMVTPQNYRLVKPLPAAFMSTGLISKRNRDPADLPGGVGNKAMPDTPCKRPALNFHSTPFPPPKSRKVSPGQHVQEADGPSTPVHPHRPPRLSTGSSGTGVGIFGSKFIEGSAAGRGIFLNIDGDDNSHSPSGKSEDQQNEYDLPPTPTKQVYSLGGTPSSSKQDNKGTSIFDRLRVGSKTVGRFSGLQLGLHAAQEPRSCKFPPLHTVFPETVQGDLDYHTTKGQSGLSSLRFSPSHTPSLPSFKRSRLLRKGPGGPSPSSLSLNTHLPTLSLPPSSTYRSSLAKPGTCPPASPIDHLDLAQTSPRTPQESMMPPDPSGLSISGHGSLKANSMFPPATPTTGHHGRVANIFGGFATNDVDVSLMARFDKVELIGTGVFSTVYRVTKRPDGTPFRTSSQTSATSLPEQVFAVKKSIKPYAGNRDRERKLQEVKILKALGRSDHVVQLVDDWEERNHLYIQTEFCEEGSFDVFLTQVGRKARLDDFRIWKIMLELCLGLKHIHDSGFIHLDLKPANILITFEGVLKISDLGMATKWPAPAGIEGEGDREYIGPEILLGQFDKPADIFALGLIMVEIAGNVELPDNGLPWQKLRAGDMSDVPSLTWSSGSNIARDSSGNPISPVGSPTNQHEVAIAEGDASPTFPSSKSTKSYYQPPKAHQHREGERRHPPPFMTEPQHEEALERIVRWMISPNPKDRPVVDQILNVMGVKWAEARRRAGATVFEGNWGPADDILLTSDDDAAAVAAEDEEGDSDMMDV